MSRVFIPQHPWTFDQATRLASNEGDLSGVFKFGHPIFMLPPGKIRFGRMGVYAELLHAHMFDFTADDYVMMTGDSVVQALAVAIALQKTDGATRYIRWHPMSATFQDFKLNLRGPSRVTP